MQTLLQVEQLTKVFSSRRGQEHKAVDGVSFSVGHHEKTAIIGESGSGKTSLAQMIMRLEDVSSGQIFFEGQNITHAKGRQLREVYQKMQMVFQMPADSFDPRRTLGDGIAESLRNRGWKKNDAMRKAEYLLAECGLEKEFLTRYPHEVSGGQCQRAAIARALAVDPVLLILDEATSALDATVQSDMIRLLVKLQEDRDISYLFISHDIALVQSFCDRILVMSQGKIVEDGRTEDVIRNPRSETAKQLMDSIL